MNAPGQTPAAGTIRITHPDKVMFPGARITKADLARYYLRIGPAMVPLIRARPLTLQRFPDGIGEEGFFQKHRPDHFPGWIASVHVPKVEGGSVEHVLANDTATLVYLANHGMITPHVTLSRIEDINRPDRLILDLDPSVADDFASVRFAALRLRELMEQLGLVPFVQTTGSRGLHVVVPLESEATFERTREFARAVAQRLVAAYPERLTIEQRKNKRGDRIFLDWLRNGYGQTAVAPYGVRAIEGAPVAAPLDWHEVGTRLGSARRFNIGNLFRRLGQKPCPWRNMHRHRRSLDPAAARLASLG